MQTRATHEATGMRRGLLAAVLFAALVEVAATQPHHEAKRIASASHHGEAPLLSTLSADANAPLYTTYAAAMERSQFLLDEGYHFVYYDSTRGLCFSTDSAGDWCTAFQLGGKVAYRPNEMETRIRITTSYPDLVVYTFAPFKGIAVQAVFLVLDSRTALHEMTIRNDGAQEAELGLTSFVHHATQSFKNLHADTTAHAMTFEHREPPDRWTVQHNIPHIDSVRNLLLASERCEQLVLRKHLDPTRLLNAETFASRSDSAQTVALRMSIRLMPGASKQIRFVRAVSPLDEDVARLYQAARRALSENLVEHIHRNEQLFSTIPRLTHLDRDHQLLYWNAFTLLRQCMLPTEGNCRFNYYVFSREPQWGWGHGGQVFHESLSMLAYVLMDPMSALNSQRVFFERQRPDGYINYRTGPYLDETIPYNDQLTTSAPWLSWENWEVYKQTKDKSFLADAYRAGVRLYEYWLNNRDADRDGLCEWGGHAVLESVRDSKVAVWDQVGWPSHFEALDLNCMLVQEAKSLAQMARELGIDNDVERWKKESKQRGERINKYMWDEKTKFYYHVNRTDHSFRYQKENDLKRQEIIGFLPLWAGVADRSRAAALVQTLTDTSKFWRRYGVPTLSADDPYYDPQGYWNGPVWVQWQYLIFRGLIDYGYTKEARALAERVFAAVIAQLRTNHSFWELYSPDSPWGGWNRSYIWTGLVARMMVDLSHLKE